MRASDAQFQRNSMASPFWAPRFVALALCAVNVAACGASVAGRDRDGAVSDVASSADASVVSETCGAPIVLFEQDAVNIAGFAFARTTTGYVAVTTTQNYLMHAQLFDAQWTAVGPRLALPSQRPTRGVGFARVEFNGESGVATLGASVHLLAINDSGQLTVVRSSLLEADGAMQNAFGAWPLTDDLGRSRVSALEAWGALWHADPMGIVRAYRVQGIEPLNERTSVQFHRFEDSFIAVDTVFRRAANNDARVRQFYPGEGMMFAREVLLDRGHSAAPIVRSGDHLWRLHSRNEEPPQFPRGSFELVQHGDDGVVLSRRAINETRVVYNGAIGVRSNATAPEDMFLAWVANDVASPSRAIEAQWGSNGARRTLMFDGRVQLHGAWINSAGQAWLVYGHTAASGTGLQRVFAQCFSRS